MFIIPPRYIRVEISHQPLWRQKHIDFLAHSDMPVIAPIIVAALYAGSHVHTRLSDAQMLRMVNLLLLGSAAAVLAKAWRG
ncbi:MAG: hypothetical protein IPN00_02535 [Hydrogenophilales bacterium]|nr:hypothetical protein [Hydrogenophilales bacterium]